MTSLTDLAALRRSTRTTISVCLPARDEEATIGEIVTALSGRLLTPGFVDELLVVDDGSTDATRAIARQCGATVVSTSDPVTSRPAGTGKGAALWTSVAASTGHVVCWVDADLSDFDVDFVVRLVVPLLADDGIGFVKGHYQRNGGEGLLGGGRVTELAARPLLRRLLPHMARFPQPLSGEYAARRSVLEQLPFVVGWGVDIALLIDAVSLVGDAAVVSVDLGRRNHKHRPLHELAPQAESVIDVILDRAGVAPARFGAIEALPPLRTLPDYVPGKPSSAREAGGVAWN